MRIYEWEVKHILKCYRHETFNAICITPMKEAAYLLRLLESTTGFFGSFFLLIWVLSTLSGKMLQTGDRQKGRSLFLT